MSSNIEPLWHLQRFGSCERSYDGRMPTIFLIHWGPSFLSHFCFSGTGISRDILGLKTCFFNSWYILFGGWGGLQFPSVGNGYIIAASQCLVVNWIIKLIAKHLEMATHSSTRARRTSWTEPGRLQPMGSQRVGHVLVTEQQTSWHKATSSVGNVWDCIFVQVCF